MSVHAITDKLWPCFPFGQLESVLLPTLRSKASGTHLPVILCVSLKAGLVEPSLNLGVEVVSGFSDNAGFQGG